jgi:ABC-type transport system involved in cytochrome c biogenesis permease subunit
MATNPAFESDYSDVDWRARLDGLDFVGKLLKPLASLRLTVTLFMLSIFLVVAGTLAQTEQDIWLVIDQYFRCFIADVELKVFFSEAFFPNMFLETRPDIQGRFPFPGGWLIGGLMAVNLFAAHTVRFKSQATGARLFSGLVVIGAGMLLTTLVILSGSNKEGFQGGALLNYSQIWYMLLGGLGIAALGCFYVCLTTPAEQQAEKWMLGGLGGALLVVLGWLMTQGASGQLNDSSMRILWQLMKATFAGVVLYVGCYLVFRKRAGIVLLHGGIGLMMLSELLVGTMAVESKMTLLEGETRSYVYDIREYELAIVDSTNSDEDDVVAIPQSMFDKPGEKLPFTISHAALPFDIEVDQFFLNADIKGADKKSESPVDAGIGLQLHAREVDPVSGLGDEFNIPAMIVTFKDKDGGGKIGTHLMSLLLAESDVLMGRPPGREIVTVKNKPYDVSLRFRRSYKPYQLTLNDVRKDDYVGTDTPKNYSSDVHLVDTSRNVDRNVRIWMNNPLRFAGETFYQSGYNQLENGTETTTLAVVTNTGWMIPYVSCMIVIVGMLGQFLLLLSRFLRRRHAEDARLNAEPVVQSVDVTTTLSNPVPRSAGPRYGNGVMVALPLALSLLCMAWIGSKARTPQPTAEGFNLYEFGQIPVAYGGRVKPIDTLARNSLRMISDREEVIETYETDGKEKTRKLPATRWLLDIIANPEEGDKQKVFRIKNLELLTTLGLERREGFRYSLSEVMQNEVALVEQAKRAHTAREEKRLTIFDRKVLELESQIGVQRMIQTAFKASDFEPDMSHEELVAIVRRVQALRDRKLALAVPTEADEASKSWQSYYSTSTRNAIEQFAKSKGATTSAEVGAKLVDSMSESAPLMMTASFLKLLQGASESESRPVPQIAAEMTLRLSGNPFLQEILRLIADAPADSSAEEIIGKLPDDKITELRQLRIRQSFQDMISGVPAGMRPVASSNPERRTFVDRMTAAAVEQIYGADGFSTKTDPAASSLGQVLTAYEAGDAKAFNDGVQKHQETVAALAPQGFNSGKIRFESFFNNMAPLYYPLWIYLFAGILSFVAWLGWSVPLNRVAFWLIAATLVIHTFALISRIYISGRPPVTNLYSSAVFIGWAMVVLGLVFEAVFKMGIGNLVAAIAGSSTLAIAHQLAGDGDTFTVLQAVLDTQFWLATHVVCITLGYATTFVAGLLGLIYVIAGVFSPNVDSATRRRLTSMIYGTLCFAIFFSFFGTVLGGLWADDSWGRFWGWDPKENGALVIVIWNALVLHARWGGMVRGRGMAILAIVGNIWTACSWFGVNELGVGLHAYGFREGMLKSLAIFIVSQFIIIAIGLLPLKMWWSHRKHDVVK